jgi:hypothetical protein
MTVRRRWAALVALGLTVAGCGGGSGGDAEDAAAGAGRFSIAIWGDTPYSPAEAIAVPDLIDQVNASDVAFTVFVGDLQGSGRCANGIFTDATDRFNSFVKPLVYTPGDNEWTDCHVTAEDPIDRLAYLRKSMFRNDRSFGGGSLTVRRHRQRTDRPLIDLATGQPVANVTRVETFGSPAVGWVKVIFDPQNPAFVEAEPHPVLSP